jgi:hypothetical protein
MHRIISGRRVLAWLTLAVAMLMAGCGSSPEADPTEPTSKVDAGTTAPTEPTSKVDGGTTAPSPQPLFYRSGAGAEVAIYADGRVIWPIADGDPGYLAMRLTPEAVERLRSRAVSTGLFQQDQLLTLDHRPGGMEVGKGYMEVRRDDRSVVVVWGEDVSAIVGSGIRLSRLEMTSAATAEQKTEVIELLAFFRDPTAWRLPRRMYMQPGTSPFVPSRLRVVYDGGAPDWSKVPSPAREIIGSSRLEGLSRDPCRVISTDEAREIARALTQAGIEAGYDRQRGSFGFSAAGSFVHSFPALPHQVAC